MTTSTAQQIRSALKTELNITARQVGVRADSGRGIDGSATVTVKADVDVAAVEAIAARFERIDRCQITGDILAGGNIYVSVNVTREAQAAIGAPFAEAVAAAFAELVAAPSASLVDVAPGVAVGGSRYDFRIWTDGVAGMHVSEADVDFASYTVARQVAAQAAA